MDQVEVNWVMRIRGKLPDFGRAQLGAGVDARGVEHLAVDGPHYLIVRRSLGKTELARKPRAGLAKRLERAHVRESLGHRAGGDGRPKQSPVAAHLPKRGTVRRLRLEREHVAAGVRSVEDPEAVAGIGNLHEGPRNAVDEDDISEEAFHIVLLNPLFTLQRGVA